MKLQKKCKILKVYCWKNFKHLTMIWFFPDFGKFSQIPINFLKSIFFSTFYSFLGFWEQNGILARTGAARAGGIYNRCKIKNGKVYGTGKRAEHPKPILIKCIPGYSLVSADDTQVTFFEQTFCEKRTIIPPVKCLRGTVLVETCATPFFGQTAVQN